MICNRVVHRYTLEKGVNIVKDTGLIKILRFKIHEGKPTVWIENYLESKGTDKIEFIVVFTGEPFFHDQHQYVGTDIDRMGFVFHCYYKIL